MNMQPLEVPREHLVRECLAIISSDLAHYLNVQLGAFAQQREPRNCGVGRGRAHPHQALLARCTAFRVGCQPKRGGLRCASAPANLVFPIFCIDMQPLQVPWRHRAGYRDA